MFEHDDIMDSPNTSISNDPSMSTSTNIWLFPYIQNEVYFAQQLNWDSQFINAYIWYACVGNSQYGRPDAFPILDCFSNSSMCDDLFPTQILKLHFRIAFLQEEYWIVHPLIGIVSRVWIVVRQVVSLQ